MDKLVTATDAIRWVGGIVRQCPDAVVKTAGSIFCPSEFLKIIIIGGDHHCAGQSCTQQGFLNAGTVRREQVGQGTAVTVFCLWRSLDANPTPRYLCL